jgi:hypothetical protein
VEHLTTEELAAYLSAALHGEELSRVESHLTQCDDCRSEVIEGRRAIDAASSIRRPASRPSRLLLAGLAAAAVVLFAIWPTHERTLSPADRIVRGAGALPKASSIGIVAPDDGGRLDPLKSIFIWHRDGDASTYRLTLTDESGGIVWTTNTADTGVALPPSVVLERGRRFFWYVDALRADGRSMTSGVHDFTVSR